MNFVTDVSATGGEPVVCSRELHVAQLNRDVIARIRRPVTISEDLVASCIEVEFFDGQINGTGQYLVPPINAVGIDTMQSMQDAFDLLRSNLDKTGYSFTSWKGGEGTNICKTIRGQSFSLQVFLEQLVETELERIISEVQKEDADGILSTRFKLGAKWRSDGLGHR